MRQRTSFRRAIKTELCYTDPFRLVPNISKQLGWRGHLIAHEAADFNEDGSKHWTLMSENDSKPKCSITLFSREPHRTATLKTELPRLADTGVSRRSKLADCIL